MRIYLDTETTGLHESRLVELAFAVEDSPIVTIRVKPPVPVEIEASVVNHITNDMVASLRSFLELPEYGEIKELLESNTIIAHNASFDVGVLNREGIFPMDVVCTKKLSQELLAVNKHNLQYLRYAIPLTVEGAAHTASGDVEVLRALYTHLMNVSKETAVV